MCLNLDAKVFISKKSKPVPETESEEIKESDENKFKK